MSKTKIFLGTAKIIAVYEKSYNGVNYYEYACENGDIFNSTKRYEINDIISIYLSKYNNSLTLNYSLKDE